MLEAVVDFFSSSLGLLVFLAYIGSVFVDSEVKAFFKHPLTTDVLRTVLIPVSLIVVGIDKIHAFVRRRVK